MADNEDKLIISKVLKGNKMAFGELIIKYQQPVFRIAYRLTGSHEDARDITQDVFLKIYENLHQYKHGYKFFSWLYRSAINESLDLINKKKKIDHQAEIDNMPDMAEEEPDKGNIMQDAVRKALLNLPDKQKSLLIMKYYGGYSYEEISKLTGLTVKRVKSRLYDGRDKLRKLLS